MYVNTSHINTESCRMNIITNTYIAVEVGVTMKQFADICL